MLVGGFVARLALVCCAWSHAKTVPRKERLDTKTVFIGSLQWDAGLVCFCTYDSSEVCEKTLYISSLLVQISICPAGYKEHGAWLSPPKERLLEMVLSGLQYAIETGLDKFIAPLCCCDAIGAERICQSQGDAYWNIFGNTLMHILFTSVMSFLLIL